MRMQHAGGRGAPVSECTRAGAWLYMGHVFNRWVPMHCTCDAAYANCIGLGAAHLILQNLIIKSVMHHICCHGQAMDMHTGELLELC